MERANRFLQLYNQLVECLRNIPSTDRSAPFYQLVDQAAEVNAVVRKAKDRLKDYGDLRNAIVHHRSYPAEIIAEPMEETVQRLEKVVALILAPILLIPAFQRSIQCFTPSDQLVTALRYMKDQDFSQIVVQKEGLLSLLTAEGVARWLEQQTEEDIISVTEATVGDALACDIPNSFLIMSRDKTLYDARETFTRALEQQHPRLFAIIITHNGKSTEKPIGIVTPWDLLDDGNG